MNLRLLASYLPPKWLFKREFLDWANDERIVRQLPLLHRVVPIYARIYFKVGRTAYQAIAARYLFFLISFIYKRIGGRDILPVTIGPYRAFINVHDPRYMQVLDELALNNNTSTLNRLLKAGDTFVDVGANQGAHSIVASHIVGSTGAVVAIEPQPSLFDGLEQSLRASPAGTVVTSLCALGEEDGEVDLYVPVAYSGMAGVHTSFSGARKHLVTRVSMRRFDDHFDWSSYPGNVVLKLDIEGAELSFLRGAARFIENRRPTIVMEINPLTLSAAEVQVTDLTAFLIDSGYSTYSDVQAPNTTLPLARLEARIHQNIVVFP